MRGEYKVGNSTKHSELGSSPHARGILLDQLGYRLIIGFIPACAGNTHDATQKFAVPRVHPRMRGEYGYMTPISPPRRGSSPHARGIRRSTAIILCVLRFIPACAGNTSDVFAGKCYQKVHPRMRGEYMPRISSLI